MTKNLSINDWIEILQNKKLTHELDLAIFQTLYSFEEHKAFASQVGRILGYTGKAPQSPLNLEIGKYAKRIAKVYDIDFTIRSARKFKYWDLFFNGWDVDTFFIWQLKAELVEALEDTSLTGEEKFAEEIEDNIEGKIFEGAKKTIKVNVYERNSKARQLCIKNYGVTCSICGFNFENKYGNIGKNFIHVHHLAQLSEIRENYQVDPINDLKPICPNCHSMIHKKEPPYTIDELKQLLIK